MVEDIGSGAVGEQSGARRWALAVGAVGVLVSFAGGAVIGLAPWYTLALVVVWLIGAVSLVRWRVHSRDRSPQPSARTVVGAMIVAGIVVLGLIQAVPYGRAHSNPAPTGEPAWATPRTRELMVNACFGCHSNEAEWPWYSNVAPISWAVTDHVADGRDAVNYSEFSTDAGEADETLEVIKDGSMPPRYYTAFGLHPEADLSDAEIAELVSGLLATPGLVEHGPSGIDDATGDDDRSGDDDGSGDDDSS